MAAFDPITAVSNVVGQVIDRVWPDPAQAAAAKLQLLQLQQNGELAQITGQMNANTAQASNPSLFVSGARPFIMWVCGFACAWNWLGISIARTACALLHYPITLTPADTSEMMPMLTALLGLGAYRTVEKIKGVARNSLADPQ